MTQGDKLQGKELFQKRIQEQFQRFHKMRMTNIRNAQKRTQDTITATTTTEPGYLGTNTFLSTLFPGWGLIGAYDIMRDMGAGAFPREVPTYTGTPQAIQQILPPSISSGIPQPSPAGDDIFGQVKGFMPIALGLVALGLITRIMK